MARQRFPLDTLNIEDKNIQPALRRHTAVLLTQGAGGRVARIFKRLLLIFKLARHNAFKAGARHINLPAHLDQRQRLRQRHRDRTHRFQIFRHVLACNTVAARGAAEKYAVLIFKRDRKSVYLRFNDINRTLDLFAHARVERLQFGRIKHILKGTHLHLMAHRRKCVERRAADTPCRRMVARKLRKRFLQINQLVQKPVIFIIADSRTVEHIVAVIMLFNDRAQLLYTALCRFQIFTIHHFPPHCGAGSATNSVVYCTAAAHPN